MNKTITKLVGRVLFALLFVPGTAEATITATWDWENNIPSATIRTVNIQGGKNTGYVESDVTEVSFYVDATCSGGKLAYVSDNGYAQFNAGTKIQIPVVSTDDKITVKTYSGQHKYTFGDDAATADEQTFEVTAAQVSAGYAEIVSTAYMNIYSIKAVLARKPFEIAAKWSFDTGYDIDGRICTPNGSDWAAIPSSATQAKNNAAYQFNANTRYQSNKNYLASIGNDNNGKTYYWITGNNGDKVLDLYPNGTVNAISGDYTDAFKHLSFYEFSFPTTGLKDIKMTVEFTYHSGAGKTMELVYSTDGGSTWTDAGSIAGGPNWYTYATTTKEISADNKENVLVHLLPEDGNSSQVYINSVTITGVPATTLINITDAKYATYYNSIPVELPANLEAATVDDETSGTLTFNYRYSEGDVIPSGTPVLLKATAAGEYTLTYAANDATAAPTGNYLYGSDEAVTTTGGGTGAKYYALQYGAGDKASVLGFYWVNTDGAAFTSGAHKAWLALPAAASASYLSLDADDMTMGIEHLAPALSSGEGAQSVFNLNGQRVSQPRKGLYLVNGKKVIINK